MAVSKSQLSRALLALKLAGTPGRGILCLPDGSSVILTEAPATPLPSNDDAMDWLELAGGREATHS